MNIDNILLDKNGVSDNKIIHFSYKGKGCTINGRSMVHQDIFIDKDFEKRTATKSVDGGTIVLEIKKAGSN